MSDWSDVEHTDKSVWLGAECQLFNQQKIFSSKTMRSLLIRDGSRIFWEIFTLIIGWTNTMELHHFYPVDEYNTSTGILHYNSKWFPKNPTIISCLNRIVHLNLGLSTNFFGIQCWCSSLLDYIRHEYNRHANCSDVHCIVCIHKIMHLTYLFISKSIKIKACAWVNLRLITGLNLKENEIKHIVTVALEQSANPSSNFKYF